MTTSVGHPFCPEQAVARSFPFDAAHSRTSDALPKAFAARQPASTAPQPNFGFDSKKKREQR